MNFDQKALSIEILGFKRENRTYRMNMTCLWNMMSNWSDIKQILTSLGEISKRFGERMKGKLVMPHLSYSK